jgi:hypothetical protein
VDVECGYDVSDARSNPEEDAIAQQRREIMTCVLRGVSRRDREILTRFYLLGESQEKICSEMDLTETEGEGAIRRAWEAKTAKSESDLWYSETIFQLNALIDSRQFDNVCAAPAVRHGDRGRLHGEREWLTSRTATRITSRSKL